jgi:hypothetical protein
MDFKKNLRKFGPLVAFILILGIVLTVWILYIPIMNRPPIPGEKKAIILASANDFYRKEGVPDFNDGKEANFNSESNNWTITTSTDMFGGASQNDQGHNSLGVFRIFKTGGAGTPPLNGVRVGLRWLNSSNDIVRTDWSNSIYETIIGWTSLSVTGVNNNTIGYEITQLQLVFAVEGDMPGDGMILFDEVRVEHWFPPPIPIPIPSNIDTDGFPAQALQVYWILRNHGYTDSNIFLMLYHTGDSVIDIDATDGVPNDLIGAVVDVENDDVNASRFIRELDVSFPSSFASNITGRDQLIIYMVDHGSNKVLGDGNATFHFEADNSFLNESKFVELVSQISYKRLLINIDICFSGNFLNEFSNIGSSWYNIPNSILITSTSDLLSWYWRDNVNADGFAGSFFFHHFWDQLDQNQTVIDAFNFAKNRVPLGKIRTVEEIQSPLIQDNLGISATWSFNSDPSL